MYVILVVNLRALLLKVAHEGGLVRISHTHTQRHPHTLARTSVTVCVVTCVNTFGGGNLAEQTDTRGASMSLDTKKVYC